MNLPPPSSTSATRPGVEHPYNPPASHRHCPDRSTPNTTSPTIQHHETNSTSPYDDAKNHNEQHEPGQQQLHKMKDPHRGITIRGWVPAGGRLPLQDHLERSWNRHEDRSGVRAEAGCTAPRAAYTARFYTRSGPRGWLYSGPAVYVSMNARPAMYSPRRVPAAVPLTRFAPPAGRGVRPDGGPAVWVVGWVCAHGRAGRATDGGPPSAGAVRPSA